MDWIGTDGKGADRKGADRLHWTGMEWSGSDGIGTERLERFYTTQLERVKMISNAYYEKYQVSKQLRYGNKKQKAALDKFVNLRKFGGEKPTPEQLTKECLRKSSPLYGIMKTTVRTAAKAYWRITSQDILRHIELVRIDIVTSEILNKPVKAYIPIKREQYGRIPESNYRPTVQIQKNPKEIESLLSQMQLEFIAWMSRWERYAEFFEEFEPVIEAYHKIEARLDTLTLSQAAKKKKKT